MEALGEEDTLATQAMECSRDLELGDRESMSQMQDAIHVWVRKVARPPAFSAWLVSSGRIDFEQPALGPALLRSSLDGQQLISLGVALRLILQSGGLQSSAPPQALWYAMLRSCAETCLVWNDHVHLM